MSEEDSWFAEEHGISSLSIHSGIISYPTIRSEQNLDMIMASLL